jgi:hypothetical protein
MASDDVFHLLGELPDLGQQVLDGLVVLLGCLLGFAVRTPTARGSVGIHDDVRFGLSAGATV